MHNYYRGSCPEKRYRLLRLMTAAIVKLRGSITVRRKTERGSGIGTKQTGTSTPKQEINSGQVVPIPGKPVPIPQSRKSIVAKWYRYHTYWYWYQHVIFVGFEQNSNSSARVHLSFDHQFEITMEKSIKAKGGVERSSF